MSDKVWLDLDDFWPPTSALAGLVFENLADFERARALIREDPDEFHLANPDERYLVVRKTDVGRLTAAGLAFQQIELIDADSLPPEERYRHQLAIVQSEAVQKRMAEMLGRPDRAP